MKTKQVAALACFTTMMATSGMAAVMSYDVHANTNVWNEGKGADDILNGDPGLATGLTFALGDSFEVAVDNPADTWNFCSPSASCTVNADGVRPALGTVLGTYSDAGASFSYGTLVGRVGLGAFFAIGTAGFDGTANAAGELKLYHWDHNNNNSGSLAVSVTYNTTPIPLPAGLSLLLTGMAGFGALRLRKSRAA